MKKFRKTVLILLSITIMAGAFVACSKKNDDIEDNPDINVETTIPSEDVVEDATEDKKEEVGNNSSTTNKNEQGTVSGTPVIDNKKDYTLLEVMNNIISAIPKDEHNMNEMPVELYNDMYGIDKSQFEDVLVFGSMMSVKSNEIILIKLKKESDASTAIKLLESRKEQLYKTWEHYLPDQFELVKQAQIKTNGKYVALIVAPYAKEVSSKFMNIK